MKMAEKIPPAVSTNLICMISANIKSSISLQNKIINFPSLGKQCNCKTFHNILQRKRPFKMLTKVFGLQFRSICWKQIHSFKESLRVIHTA